MKICISGQALDVKPLEYILKALVERGVYAVELWPDNIALEPGAKWTPGYRERGVEDAKKLLTEYGVIPACVTMSGAFHGDFVADAGLYADSLRHTVEVAAEMGASLVNHYCFNIALDEEPDMGMMARYYEPALRRAEELGITMVLENEAHDATRRPEGMLGILEYFDSPRFATTYDPCNYHQAGAEGFPYAYEILKDHIKYIHIKNGCIYNPVKHGKTSVRGGEMTGGYSRYDIAYPPLPNGAVNVDGLLLRLVDDGYDGYCTLEPHVPVDLVEKYYDWELSYLRSRNHIG